MSVPDDDLKKAILKVDLMMKQRQFFWEGPKAIAMMLIAAAAISAAGGLAGHIWPPKPQQIIVNFGEQPLNVKLVQ